MEPKFFLDVVLWWSCSQELKWLDNLECRTFFSYRCVKQLFVIVFIYILEELGTVLIINKCFTVFILHRQYSLK